jgi:hypothetical protein
MRALCGAIITAGALIGLGLAAMGIGNRYGDLSRAHTDGTMLVRNYENGEFTRGMPNKDNGPAWVKYSEMDRGLTAIVAVLILTVMIGLATCFIGLMYHHHRRLHEMTHHLHPEPRQAA